MNIRNVLRVYSLLRNFADDETALLEILRGLTDSDREQLVESLAPAKPAVKKRKPRASRSPRAESLATAIRHDPTHPSLTPCGYISADGTGIPCDLTEDSRIHDPTAGYIGYHLFVAPTTVRSARGQSLRNGETGSPAASFVTEMVDAGVAARAAGEGVSGE